MNITVSKKDLLWILGRCIGSTDARSAMPALACVLLDVGDSVLRVSATDMFRSMSGVVDCTTTEAGTYAVNARDILERVKAMPDGDVSLSASGSKLEIKSGKARKFSLPCLTGEDFPKLPAIGEAKRLAIPPAVLGGLLDRIHFSISTDETRAHVNSALVEFDGTTLRLVSTDGHRLSKAEATVETDLGSGAALIPLKAVSELRKLVSDSAGAKQFEMVIAGGNVFFVSDSLTFSAKLVDNTFPPYKQVIPKKPKHKIVVSRADLASAIGAVSVSCNVRTGGVYTAIGDGKILVTGESAETGSGYDEVEAETGSADVKVGMNAKYALDILNALDCDTMTIKVDGELDPIVFEPSGSSDYVAVVMPMRI